MTPHCFLRGRRTTRPHHHRGNRFVSARFSSLFVFLLWAATFTLRVDKIMPQVDVPLSEISLIFVSQNPQYGSAIMRGRHFITEWGQEKHATEGGKNTKLHLLSNTVVRCGTPQCADICVFIGPCRGDCYSSCSCCRIRVLDIVDKYLFSKDIIDKHLHEYDAIVVNSNYMETFFRFEHGFTGEILVLAHHADPRWRKTSTIETGSKLRFGYIGSIPSLEHTDNFLHSHHLRGLYPITLVDTDEGKIPSEVDFQMDISLRPEGMPVSRFKTSAKVATAAALGHNIITTWEEAVKDCLPPTYPFILKQSSLESAVKMFNDASQDYEGKQVLWKKGLEVMGQVNRSLSLSALATKYEVFLKNIHFSKYYQLEQNSLNKTVFKHVTHAHGPHPPKYPPK